MLVSYFGTKHKRTYTVLFVLVLVFLLLNVNYTKLSEHDGEVMKKTDGSISEGHTYEVLDPNSLKSKIDEDKEEEIRGVEEQNEVRSYGDKKLNNGVEEVEKIGTEVEKLEKEIEKVEKDGKKSVIYEKTKNNSPKDKENNQVIFDGTTNQKTDQLTSSDHIQEYRILNNVKNFIKKLSESERSRLYSYIPEVGNINYILAKDLTKNYTKYGSNHDILLHHVKHPNNHRLSINPLNCTLKTSPCPKFSSCSYPDLSIVSYCTSEIFNEEEDDKMNGLELYNSNAYEFRNVLVSVDGYIHNQNNYSKTFHVDGGGCWNGMKNTSPPSIHTHLSINITEAIYCTVRYSYSYYHMLFETVPMLVLLKPIILANPNIPVIFSGSTKIEDALLLAGLVDIKVNYLLLPSRVMAVVDKLYALPFTGCAKYPPKLWYIIRQNLLNNLIPNLLKSKSNLTFPTKRPTILLGQRKDSRRLDNFTEINEIIKQKYPDQVFYFLPETKYNLIDTMMIFYHADIFVSPHGAGFANILFMKEESALVEIMPKDYQVYCYRSLSQVFGFKYYGLMEEGDNYKHLTLKEDTFQQLLYLVDQAVNSFSFPN